MGCQLRTAPDSTDLRQSRSGRRPGILNGLDGRTVIPLEEMDEHHRRHTTRQSVHGRQSALYDTKYHPLDEITAPSRAKAHRRRLGLLEETKVTGFDHPSRHSAEEESECFSVHSTDEESEDDVRPAKRQRKIQSLPNLGSRHSARLSVRAQKVPLYNMKVHPQDAILKQLEGTRHESAPRQRRRKEAEKAHVHQEDEENKENRMHEDQEGKAEGEYDFGTDGFTQREMEPETEEDTRSKAEGPIDSGNESVEEMQPNLGTRSALLTRILAPIPFTLHERTLGPMLSSPPSVPWVQYMRRDRHDGSSGAFDSSQYLEDQNIDEDNSDAADQANEISNPGLAAENQVSSQRIAINFFPRFPSPEQYETSGLNLDLDQYFPVQE
jgi:hypothetical protein